MATVPQNVAEDCYRAWPVYWCAVTKAELVFVERDSESFSYAVAWLR